MAKKVKKQKEVEVEMTCAVCTKCIRCEVSFRYGIIKCIYGGPYDGYINVT